MQIELTWQTLLTVAAVIGAFVAVVSYLRKLFGWFEKQEMQDKSIKDIQKEQYVLTNGILACLKGLVELGCDGAVKGEIANIEKQIKKKAHGQTDK